MGVDGIFLPAGDPASDDTPTSKGEAVQVHAMLLIEDSWIVTIYSRHGFWATCFLWHSYFWLRTKSFSYARLKKVSYPAWLAHVVLKWFTLLYSWCAQSTQIQHRCDIDWDFAHGEASAGTNGCKTKVSMYRALSHVGHLAKESPTAKLISKWKTTLDAANSKPELVYPAISCAFGHRLFLTSYMLFLKVICDDTYSNKVSFFYNYFLRRNEC